MFGCLGFKEWLLYPPDESPESYTPALELFTKVEPLQRERHGVKPIKWCVNLCRTDSFELFSFTTLIVCGLTVVCNEKETS